MKLIQDAIRLPLAWPDVAVIMGLWLVLLAERPSSTIRVVGQEIANTVFKNSSSTVTLYLVFGGGGSKNNQEIKKRGR